MTTVMNYEGANCVILDPDKFYPEKGSAQIQARDAKAVCNGTVAGMAVCIRRSECLEFALENRERFGVWGGLSERERTRLIKERKAQAALEATPEWKRRKEFSGRALVGWQKAKRRQKRLTEYGSKFFTSERTSRDASMGSRRAAREHATPREADRGAREDR
jgi:WhiB family redox-sensing transcriptional regulator